MTNSFKRTPTGWTEQGAARGWQKPAPNPHRSEVDRLKAENAALQQSQADLLARVEALEAKKSKK